MQSERNGYLITDDPARLNLDAICRLLGGSYWAAQRPREVIERSLRNSICFGLYFGPAQVGFARVVTDSATFSWICDVIIDPAHRSAGLGTWLVECVLAHPIVATTVKLLRTRDAHALYEQYGFARSECMLLRPPALPDWQPAS